MPQAKPPHWSRLEQDVPKPILALSPTGAKAATDILHLSISLPYRDAEGMDRFDQSVSDPGSPNYRRFLSPEEIGQRFGFSQAEVKKVTDYLTSQGMKIQLVAKSRLSVIVEATVAQAEKAFQTSISEFVVPDPEKGSGVLRFSYTTPPSVPTTLSPYIRYIGGLENLTRPKRMSTSKAINPIHQ
jgi:kumamolisin